MSKSRAFRIPERDTGSLVGIAFWILLAGAVAAGEATAQPGKFDQALQQTQKTFEDSKASQRKIDALDSDTASMLQRYRSALLETRRATDYAQQIEQLAAAQAAEQKTLERQFDSIDDIERDLLPLMLKMTSTLAEFVERDLPFLQQERRDRVASLKALMADPGRSVGEKFQRVLEAYQIEDEYGRALGVERSERGGKVYELLRVGRTMLYAVSLDGRSAEQWNAPTRQWQALPRRYLPDLRQAVKIARGSAAADLLLLPALTARSAP